MPPGKRPPAACRAEGRSVAGPSGGCRKPCRQHRRRVAEVSGLSPWFVRPWASTLILRGVKGNGGCENRGRSWAADEFYRHLHLGSLLPRQMHLLQLCFRRLVGEGSCAIRRPV